VRAFTTIGGGELSNLATLETLVDRFGRRDGWAAFNDLNWINDPSAPTYIQEKIGGDYTPGVTKSAALPSHLQGVGNMSRLALIAENQRNKAFDEANRVGALAKLGSYSWTLSPEMTGTGYPILVGEVQAGHSVPSIIYEVHLKGGDFDVVGASVPLLPFVLVGHNQNMAWSIMVGMCDNADIYQEILNPNNKEEYLHKGQWHKMEKRTEKIAIAGGQVKEVIIYRTIHGPVFSPFPFDPRNFDGDRVYTKKIAWWQTEDIFAEGLLRIDMAGNLKEFDEAMALHMATVHYTYGDVKGNIAYWHNGLNPERTEGFDPRLPLPGTGEAEWTGRYLPNAHVVNPPKGYVAGWNNKASPDTRNPFHTNPNYHYGGYHRSLWLYRALDGRKDLDLDANKELMRYLGGAGIYYLNDHNALGYACKALMPYVAKAVGMAEGSEKQILDKVMKVLAHWDGRAVNDVVNDDRFQAGQTIYNDWLPRLMMATFGDELEGIEEFKTIHHKIFGLFLRCLEGPISTLPVSRNYFDDINTQQEETTEGIFLETLRESVAKLKAAFETEDPMTWRAPRGKIIFEKTGMGKVAEMWDNNIGTYIIVVEVRPEGPVGYSRFPLGQSGNINIGPDQKPVFDPHFFDMQPLYQGYTYQKMGMD